MAHPTHPVPAPPRKKWKWLRRFLILVLLVAILLWFAPAIVAQTGLRNRLLAYALKDLNGSLTADDASLGWFRPVELRGVKLNDTNGHTIASAEKIVVGKSPLGLFRDRSDLGVIEVDGPVMTLVVGEKTTNVESVLKNYLGGPATGPRTAVTVVVRDGKGNLPCPVSDFEGSVTVPKDRAEPITVRATTRFNEAATSLGPTEDRLLLEGTIGETGRITASGKRIPVTLFAAIVNRYDPKLDLTGRLSGKVTVAWAGDSLSVDGAVNGSDVTQWLGPDRWEFPSADLVAKFTVAGRTLTAEALKLSCEAGTVSLTGSVDLSGDFAAAARKPGLKADADLNLTKLAALMPRLFRVRPGTELSGGQLKASVVSSAGPNGTVWTGELSTSSVRAVRDGKPVVWDQPLRAGFAARLGADDWPVFDTLEVQSDFIGLAARGSAESFVSAATIDLGKLAARLRDFIDLEGIRLEGLAEVKLNSKAVPEGGFAVDANAILTRFAVFDATGLGIHEPELDLTLTARLTRELGRVRIDSGRLTLAAAGDSAEVTLTEPVADLATFDSGRATVVAAGNLTHWQDRLRPFLILPPDSALHGKGKLAGSVAFSHRKIGFDGTLNVEKLTVGPPAKPTWVEPTVGLAAKGELDIPGDAVRFDRLKVERDGLAADAKGTVSDLSLTQDIRFDGTIAYDLAKLEPKLREFLGKGAKVTGSDSRSFRLAGKLGGAERHDPILSLSGAAAVGWQSLRAYGFDVGPADLRATLDAGVVTFSPVAATFGGGQVRVSPTLTLAPDAYQLSFAKGKVVDRAKLTPAVCADAMGFVLPVIANATQSEGLVSFDLAESRIPLADPNKAFVKGTLTLHAVKVSPGPVATELATLLGATNVTLTIANEQPVAVRVEGGRVYHDNLAIDLRGYSIKTSGSVGFDGTLNLVADLPLPSRLIDSALGDRPLLKDALAKKRINVTIGGTLAQPRLDPKAFQAAAQKLVQEAIKSAADEALRNGFRGLLQPKK